MKKLTQEELLMVEELQQHLSGETYTVLMEEDTSEKEKYREAKREFIRKCSQLFVVDGAEFLCGPHPSNIKMSFSLLFHGIWTYKIYLKSYNDQTKEGIFEYHLQDHFGLDVLDIMVHSERFFIEWFILQHFWGVKPYATELIFEEPLKIDN